MLQIARFIYFWGTMYALSRVVLKSSRFLVSDGVRVSVSTSKVRHVLIDRSNYGFENPAWFQLCQLPAWLAAMLLEKVPPDCARLHLI